MPSLNLPNLAENHKPCLVLTYLPLLKIINHA